MITKGIVRQILDKDHVRVSVPALGQLEDNPNFNLEKLPVAQLCSIPGITASYRLGDVVYVELEDDDLFRPVILGGVSDKMTSRSDATFNEISVRSMAALPQNQKTGDMTIISAFEDVNEALIELADICNRTFIGGNRI